MVEVYSIFIAFSDGVVYFLIYFFPCITFLLLLLLISCSFNFVRYFYANPNTKMYITKPITYMNKLAQISKVLLFVFPCVYRLHYFIHDRSKYKTKWFFFFFSVYFNIVLMTSRCWLPICLYISISISRILMGSNFRNDCVIERVSANIFFRGEKKNKFIWLIDYYLFYTRSQCHPLLANVRVRKMNLIKNI